MPASPDWRAAAEETGSFHEGIIRAACQEICRIQHARRSMEVTYRHLVLMGLCDARLHALHAASMDQAQTMADGVRAECTAWAEECRLDSRYIQRMIEQRSRRYALHWDPADACGKI